MMKFAQMISFIFGGAFSFDLYEWIALSLFILVDREEEGGRRRRRRRKKEKKKKKKKKKTTKKKIL